MHLTLAMAESMLTLRTGACMSARPPSAAAIAVYFDRGVPCLQQKLQVTEYK